MPLSPGEKLGPYEVVAPIGKGGMGEVYKARDTRLDRVVAIKVSAAQFSERFEREAKAIAALNHPSVCTLYDVGPNYLVMEYIEGAPLKGPLPVDQTLRYAVQICDALDAAHKKGITHRDLKPANILLTKAGIKLLDFGLAKLGTSGIGPAAKPPDDATLTMALTGKNEIVGTLYYMSPEQLQSQANGREIDGRSDIFSFGLVLYEILTGKRAFEGSSPASVIAAIMERPAPSITDVAPPALDWVLRRCLEKDPENRWQTARDLKGALEWVNNAPEPGRTPPLALRSGKWSWIAGGVLALIATALGVAMYRVTLAAAHLREAPADDRPYRLQIDPPESGKFIFGNNLGGVAVSPDGSTAVYPASANGETGVWVRPLDGTSARRLAGTDGGAYPFFSPDSKSIAFFARGQLLRVALEGGALFTICSVPGTTGGIPGGSGGVWNSDGNILFGALTSGLFVVPASGGAPSALTRLDTSLGEMRHSWPQMLPGGRFLYLAQSVKPENTGVYAASLAKPGERVRLLTSETNAVYAPGADGKAYLMWLHDSQLMAQEFDAVALRLTGEAHAIADPVAKITTLGQMDVAVSSGGLLLYNTATNESQFTWLDRSGKTLATVGEPAEYTTFRLSPDGRRAAVDRETSGGFDLWILDVERAVASRATLDASIIGNAAWSPDGHAILLAHSGTRNLYLKETSGTGPERRLTQSPNTQIVSDWSRDGRVALYYEIAPDTGRDLWYLPMTPEGNVKPELYLRTRFNESSGRFSPEASPNWVAYQSDESGRSEVYIDSFPHPRNKVRVSTGGGTLPQWGAGARELFYIAPDNKLMGVRLKPGKEFLEPAAPRELFTLPAVAVGEVSTYESMPDGQRFLVRSAPDQARKPLTIIVNWPALLQKHKEQK